MSGVARVACIQMNSIPCDVDSNLVKAETYIREAKSLGAEMVVLPELFNIGYDLDKFRLLKDYDATATIKHLSKMSKDLEFWIVAGLADLAEGSFYNSAYVFNHMGEVVCKYNKMNLFCLSPEPEIFQEGLQTVTFRFGDLKIGLLICYDIRFPELTTKYFEEGCNALIVMSAFPFPRLDHWRTLLKARAIENQSYVIAANRTGKDGEISFLGNSRVIDPWGTEKAVLDETEEGVLLCDIHLEKVNEVRSRMKCSDNKTRLLKYLRG